ncbi:MAG TPA: hypothetical protein VIK54_03100 [Acidimicrobiia bacterium]
MEESLFDDVGDILRGMSPLELGACRYRAHRYGIKVWFGPEKPIREHYEAQVIGAHEVEGASVLALEVGFHAEHPQAAENDSAIAHLLAHERDWRRVLGEEAEVGAFLGRQDAWRRVSEIWPDPDLGAPELGLEVALRLVDYVTAIEPVRRRRNE